MFFHGDFANEYSLFHMIVQNEIREADFVHIIPNCAFVYGLKSVDFRATCI